MKRLFLPLLCGLGLAWGLFLAPATFCHAASPSIESETASPAGQTGETGDFSDPFDDPFAAEDSQIADPLEPVNRGIFWFNDKLYIYLFKPLARGFRIVPEPGRLAIDRFFSNLGTPVRLVNCILQLKPKEAGTELGRFVVNSTVGLLGLFDPAKSWLGWKKQEEDLGQTFGRYHVGQGFYLVLPVFGPSSLRDGIGLLGDGFIDPITSPWYVKLRLWEQIALKTGDRINVLSIDKDTYESIRREQLDPYLFVRDAWAQQRAALVED
ncbi:phospholipid-binding lipoprotein MlaA [Geothermobacter ehrlichii]|uniref:Phospholipid-binding lipoprotein MlaA n=1 Tax=Geothermobacter ehrlichii TaxID=213224 RepID=A0A5D3WKT6_9BACT|nr:VacJ family lipoprotein [Geothermobacter ehrlichii]TYO98720.1 phospholipid-binding lipoprotein MlaA [Geothermobacter ehrlichii]